MNAGDIVAAVLAIAIGAVAVAFLVWMIVESIRDYRETRRRTAREDKERRRRVAYVREISEAEHRADLLRMISEYNGTPSAHTKSAPQHEPLIYTPPETTT